MKIVAYLDYNQLTMPSTNGSRVHAVSDGESSSATKAQLMEKYPSVFKEEVGLLKGEYHICWNLQGELVHHATQHATWRVPVAQGSLGNSG